MLSDLLVLLATPLTAAHIIVALEFGFRLFLRRPEARIAPFFTSRAAAFFARAKDPLAAALFAEILARASLKLFAFSFFAATRPLIPLFPRFARTMRRTTSGACVSARRWRRR